MNFLTEISIKNKEIMVIPSACNDYPKHYNIYCLDISTPFPFSYWVDWGGYFDNYVSTNIELYYEKYLIRVNTLNEVLNTPFSFYIKEKEERNLNCGYAFNDTLDIFDCNYDFIFDCFTATNESRILDSNENILYDIGELTDCGNADEINIDDILRYYDGGYAGELYSEVFNKEVLINVPNHTWLYSDYKVFTRKVIPFLTYPLNPNNPSQLIIRGEQGYPLLEIPNFSVKLSDNINGISLNQNFNIELINNDGFFDDENYWNLFNSPVSLKKSIKNISEYEDFNEIRSGYIEDVNTNFNTINISISDKLKSMNEPVCNVVGKENILIDIDNKVIGKFIPIIYGIMKVNLIKLNANSYIGAEYIYRIIGIYDRDGNLQTWSYNTLNNIITSTENASYAIIEGYTDNRIGAIIKDIVLKKTYIPWGLTNWNINEIETYISSSPRINIIISSGDVKKAIQEVLKSDMSYFIQQTDGRFTIRKYGAKYQEHLIPTWAITKKPEKAYTKATENYFSSCIINYNYTDNENYNSYLYNELENKAEFTYNKKVTKTFETNLININDVKKLAELLSKRYITMKQSIKLGLGIDTSNIELLDTVVINLNLNDRKFSNVNRFIVKSINPAQDILELEEIE